MSEAAKGYQNWGIGGNSDSEKEVVKKYASMSEEALRAVLNPKTAEVDQSREIYELAEQLESLQRSTPQEGDAEYYEELEGKIKALQASGVPYDPEMSICGGCNEIKGGVEERNSFGAYAGRLCVDCCGKYNDNCGLDEGQGDPQSLEDFDPGMDEEARAEGWDKQLTMAKLAKDPLFKSRLVWALVDLHQSYGNDMDMIQTMLHERFPGYKKEIDRFLANRGMESIKILSALHNKDAGMEGAWEKIKEWGQNISAFLTALNTDYDALIAEWSQFLPDGAAGEAGAADFALPETVADALPPGSAFPRPPAANEKAVGGPLNMKRAFAVLSEIAKYETYIQEVLDQATAQVETLYNIPMLQTMAKPALAMVENKLKESRTKVSTFRGIIFKLLENKTGLAESFSHKKAWDALNARFVESEKASYTAGEVLEIVTNIKEEFTKDTRRTEEYVDTTVPEDQAYAPGSLEGAETEEVSEELPANPEGTKVPPAKMKNPTRSKKKKKAHVTKKAMPMEDVDNPYSFKAIHFNVKFSSPEEADSFVNAAKTAKELNDSSEEEPAYPAGDEAMNFVHNVWSRGDVASITVRTYNGNPKSAKQFVYQLSLDAGITPVGMEEGEEGTEPGYKKNLNTEDTVDKQISEADAIAGVKVAQKRKITENAMQYVEETIALPVGSKVAVYKRDGNVYSDVGVTGIVVESLADGEPVKIHVQGHVSTVARESISPLGTDIYAEAEKLITETDEPS